VFYALLIPIFVIAGTVLIWSSVNDNKKMMLIPLFLAFIPLFLTMPLSLVLKTDKLFAKMVNSLTFGPPAIAIYYSTLIWIKQSSKSSTLILNSFFCLFILIPLLFILPF
jgi:hypothetical protein